MIEALIVGLAVLTVWSSYYLRHRKDPRSYGGTTPSERRKLARGDA